MRAIAVACALGLAACWGSAASPADAQRALLRDLPAGSQLVFGGDYVKMQQALADSPFAALTGVMNTTVPGLTAWQTCLLDAHAQTVGEMRYSDAGMESAYVMSNVTTATLEACAQRGHLAITVDPDRRFATVALPTAGLVGPTAFYVLPDGAMLCDQKLDFKQAMADGALPLPATTRRVLEAYVANLAHGTAADDRELLAAIDKLDMHAMMWGVGTGAGTPLGSAVGHLSMTVDMTDGLTIDAHVQLLDASLATKALDAFREVKAKAKDHGPALASMVEHVTLTRDGDQLHGTIAIPKAQLASLADMLAAARK